MRDKVFYIITGDTPGLRADAQIVASALREHFECHLVFSRKRNFHCFFKRWLIEFKSVIERREIVGIFIENIPLPWATVFTRFFLIPNQEWIRPETELSMKRCERIWCKTRYAEMLLKSKGFSTEFLGFSSIDIFLAGVEKSYSKFLHVPGRSSLKGTDKIFEVWLRHPEWPPLTVITRNLDHAKYRRENIKIITEFLSHDVLARLFNSLGVHLCVSETEGFGHYLNEACAAQSVVITTDAPPMNELVDAGTGFVVKYSSSIRQGISERFSVDSEDLEHTIARVINLSEAELVGYGLRARDAFIQRDLRFRESIKTLASNI
ncbi:glycosyltransferase [Hydrogenophaga sp.]|uniref:glycosyltransferase n=1 Tax=Hydrogenophaga sp. TaxID=1904254 RepID=UPI00273020EA|nr:glycosyltransferase [Hydrogenophaga sp.]MDP1684477.1 glycosyltransferase [Hydrogenophaga sp.]